MKITKKALAIVLSLLMMLSVCGIAASADSCTHEGIFYCEPNYAPICGTKGNIGYWWCPLCYGYFADEEATEEIGYTGAFIIDPQYEEHDILYQVTDQPVGDHVWVSSDMDSYSLQVYGKNWYQYYTTNYPYTFWYCEHCGVIEKYDSGSNSFYEKVSNTFTVHYPAGMVDLTGFILIPAANDGSVNEGAYWFDKAGYEEYLSTSLDTAKFYLNLNSRTLKVVDGSNYTDYALDGGDPILDYLHQVEVTPCQHPKIYKLEAKEPICGTFGRIECWYCYECNSYFADKEATQPLTYGQVFSVPPEYDEHDILYEIGFEESEDHVWLSYPSYYDTMYQQNVGMGLLEYYQSLGCTFWYCSHCGAVMMDSSGNYDRVEEPFMVHIPGVDPNEGFTLLPTEDSDDLEIGAYWFDRAAFVETIMSTEDPEDEDYQLYYDVYSGSQFYISDDGKTLRVVLVFDTLDIDIENPGEDDAFVLVFLKQHACRHSNMEEHPETASTCQTQGNDAYWYCPDCKTYFSDAAGETAVEANSWVRDLNPDVHEFGDWTLVRPSTCQTKGIEKRVCPCGAEETRELDLDPNVCGVISVSDIVSAQIGEYATMNVTVVDSPMKLQFVNSRGSTITYTRDNANVLEIKSNGDGNETWTVQLKVYRETDTYNIHLRYGKTWTDLEAEFTLTALQPETGVVSADVQQSAAVGSMSSIAVTVKGNPIKMQFVNSRGSTITYTRDNANVSEIKSNGDGTETWTIALKVYRAADSYTARAKYSGSGWTAEGAVFSLVAE